MYNPIYSGFFNLYKNGMRNIAIIAHVDHGKTTLVDCMLRQSGTLQEDDMDRLMDSNDQEKERGITIYAKNTAVVYKNEVINIIDTPWHADFGSEVERVMTMVDSVLLLVDAYEGPMPQTKFVLKKAIEHGLSPIVVINKIDKPTARPDHVIDAVFELMVELGANDEQLDFPVVYASAKNGYAMLDVERPEPDVMPLFDAICEHVPPVVDRSDEPLQLQIANLWYDTYLGRLGIGRVYSWIIQTGDKVEVVANDGIRRKGTISAVFVTRGLARDRVDKAGSGDIVTIAGIPDIFVGETVGAIDVEPLPPIIIDEPTLTMDFMVNDSPFAGREGKSVTGRIIEERLRRELETNVWLQIDFSDASRFRVSGRGELHLSVLIETMRREWFELQVSAPQVIMKKEEGKRLEPIEQVVIHVADEQAGGIIQYLNERKGAMQEMESENGTTRLLFYVPTRWLLGFRTFFTLMTRGEGIMYSSFHEYGDYKGDLPTRRVGSMISGEIGTAMTYSIWKLQERGSIFVEPWTQLYEGMIVGEHNKGSDIVVNMTKNKKLTNMRASGTDDNMLLTPSKVMTLEDALTYIGPDEYVEITPQSIRLRKKYRNEADRKRQEK